MASVERPTYSAAIPAHAKRITKGGRPFATWTDRKLQQVVAPVLASGKCRRTVPKRWVGIYRDHHGKKQKTKVYGDRSAALTVALQLERKAQDVRDGKAAPDSITGKAHLVDHVPDYLEAMATKGTTELHRGTVGALLRSILKRHGLTTAGKVECAKLQQLLELDRIAAVESRPGRKSAGPLSVRTRNKWTSALRSFGRWLSRTGRTQGNPFDGLSAGNADAHRKRIRRALTVAEFGRLVDAARKSKVPYGGLSGVDRARLYLLAAYTGLRVGALAKLTPEAFTWSDGRPTAVYSIARLQKNRSAHGVPIEASVGKELAAWLKARPAGQPLWDGEAIWHQRSAEMLQQDLAAADLPYVNAVGEVFDFHALRGQFGFMLAQAGVPLVAAQQLLDHSTPALTAKIYSRFGGELASEIAKLPGIGTGKLSLGAPLGTDPGNPRQRSLPKGAGGKDGKGLKSGNSTGKRKK